MDILFLIINSIIWFFFFKHLKKKYGFINVGVLYTLLYFLLSIMAIHLYVTVTRPDDYPWQGQNFFALLYLFFFIVLFSRVLAKGTYDKQCIAHPSNTYLMPIYIIIIILSLLNVITVSQDFFTGIISLATEDSYGQSLYHELSQSAHSVHSGGVINYISVVSNISQGLAPILFLYYLTTPKKKSIIVIGLGIAAFISLMQAISVGSRSAILQGLMNIGGGLLVLYRYYSSKIIRIIRPVFIIIFAIIASGFTFITISRLQTNNLNSFFFLETYASQSYLLFGHYGFDNGQVRNGDRTMPLVKSVFTKDVARTYGEREIKYNRMKLNESVFVTFVGDCVFDYGVFGGAFFLMCLYLLIRFFLINKRKILYFDQVLISYLVIFLLNGFYLWPFPDFGGNLLFCSLIFLALFFRTKRHESKICKPE
jgi:hypothetical protein